jgi:VanZ family protein
LKLLTSERHTGVLWLEYWIPLLVWVLLTQVLSSDSFSYDETERVFAPLLSFVFPDWSPERIDLAHQTIRKMSHVLEFSVMGMLAYRASRLDRTALDAVLMSGAFILLVATTDEFHQSMTISRTASTVDVGYDCIGGVVGIWFLSQFDGWSGKVRRPERRPTSSEPETPRS